MPDMSIEFASLLCSRLCHDLLSPVGAMNNGLELLVDEDDPQMRMRCMELLADSARSSAERLKFFRLAFGAAGGFGDAIDAAEAKAAIEGLLHGNNRIMLGWLVDAPTLSKVAAKILLNLAMIAIDALVRGGRLDIGVEGREVVLRAEGARLVLDAEIRATLEGRTDRAAMTSRTSGAWLVRLLAEEAGGHVEVGGGDNILLFGATLPA